MRTRDLGGLAAALALTTSVAAQAPGIADSRRALEQARQQAGAAAARADRLAAAAAGEADAAARARAEEQALAGRVEAAQASLDAARARAVLVDALLSRQRTRLAAAQMPAARLLGALESLARRPAIAAIAQPGSVDDLVHVRAVLGTALPAVRERTLGLRTDLSRARALADGARGAAEALRQGRASLETERVRLAQLEADHRTRAGALGRHAMSEQDRALALGERARDLVDRLDEDSAAGVTAAGLAALPGPVMRPLASGVHLPAPQRAYRLPVTGRLAEGLDEVSPSGVRSRGLTFAVRSGAPIVAPAAGVVRYARAFRDYGRIVIVDHGAGWSTLVTGLGRLDVEPGTSVKAGTPLGTAGMGEEPRITVELRRRGRPIDIAALVG